MTTDAKIEGAQLAFHASLLAFQSDPPSISKDSRNDFGNYDYVSLPGLLRVMLPKLGKHGFTVQWETHTPVVPEADIWNKQEHIEGKRPLVMVAVRCRLWHQGGYEMVSELSMPMPVDSKRGPAVQQLGSIVTYLRRYTLLAITGMSDGIDKDGADTGKAPAGVNRPDYKGEDDGW